MAVSAVAKIAKPKTDHSDNGKGLYSFPVPQPVKTYSPKSPTLPSLNNNWLDNLFYNEIDFNVDKMFSVYNKKKFSWWLSVENQLLFLDDVAISLNLRRLSDLYQVIKPIT
jgi:hypothetical protein